MPGDPVLESARYLVAQSLDELRASLDRLPLQALNWRPGGDATNSIAVLATHTAHATRLWLNIAMGSPLPDRNRDAEFHASAEDPDAFRWIVHGLADDSLATLQSADAVDWTAMRPTQGRGGDAPAEVPAAYALIHATEHLRGHVDQISLIRQLWEQRSPA
jgi:uncharacterized damage-inducible protein DinB